MNVFFSSFFSLSLSLEETFERSFFMYSSAVIDTKLANADWGC